MVQVVQLKFLIVIYALGCKNMILRVKTLLFLCCLAVGCRTTNNNNVLNVNDHLTVSQTTSTVDLGAWFGEYRGILPCADCEGVETRLKLMPQGNYELKLNYLGKGLAGQKEIGSFLWDSHSHTIILGSNPMDGARFKLEPGKLVQTDMVGNPLQSSSSENYELRKIK